jgi:hypothetical protein
MDPENKTGGDELAWIILAQDRDGCLDVVNVVMNSTVLCSAEDFSIS